jgi:hypothetical protein
VVKLGTCNITPQTPWRIKQCNTHLTRGPDLYHSFADGNGSNICKLDSDDTRVARLFCAVDKRICHYFLFYQSTHSFYGRLEMVDSRFSESWMNEAFIVVRLSSDETYMQYICCYEPPVYSRKSTHMLRSFCHGNLC